MSDVWKNRVMDGYKQVKCCAACRQEIPEGQEGIVLVRGKDRENPVSVYVHDNEECRKHARR